MSGASGKTPAAIHVTPEALDGGPLAYVRDGDVIRVDAETGELHIRIETHELMARKRARPTESQDWGYGRELFGAFRAGVSSAEQGASVCFTGLHGGGKPEIRDVSDPNWVNAAVDA
tara:strand:- start:251 stop:601 length:351 start_codon:yes stop_codon:yes gene_type:complete